jgi:hypothetical protein
MISRCVTGENVVCIAALFLIRTGGLKGSSGIVVPLNAK